MFNLIHKTYGKGKVIGAEVSGGGTHIFNIAFGKKTRRLSASAEYWMHSKNELDGVWNRLQKEVPPTSKAELAANRARRYRLRHRAPVRYPNKAISWQDPIIRAKRITAIRAAWALRKSR